MNKAHAPQHRICSSVRRRTSTSLHPYLAGLPLRDIIALPNIAYSGTLAAMDGGDIQEFTFNEGVSLSISCEDQDEIDHYWKKLTADGGEESVCGWLKDKYGVSWQVAPANMEELMKKPNAFKIMMQQKKIIIDEY